MELDRNRKSTREIIPKQGKCLDKNQGKRKVIVLLGDCLWFSVAGEKSTGEESSIKVRDLSRELVFGIFI